MKRALMLWKDGAITVSAVQDACGTRCSIKLKARENKSTGKKTTAYAAFSGTHWKDDTKKILKSVMTLSTEDIDTITNLAKAAAQRAMKAEGKASALNLDEDDEDEDIILRNGSESSEHEDEAGAQVPRWKSNHTFSHSLLCYMLSNIVFKLPKQGDRRPPLMHMTSKFVIRTSIGEIIPTYCTIAPHALGVLRLTLRCTTLAPQRIIKTAVRARITVQETMSTLGLYDATKNILNWKVRPRLIVIMTAELWRKVMCHAMGGLGPSM